MKDEYKYKKFRLARDTEIPTARLREYFPTLKRAVQQKIFREYEIWPKSTRKEDEEYEKAYKNILRKVRGANDKEGTAGNS